MATTVHQTAVFDEGFILVGVDSDDAKQLGEKQLWELIQGHPWTMEQNIPVVIVYKGENGMRAYGDAGLVEAIQQKILRGLFGGIS
jgi:hypothetical protein